MKNIFLKLIMSVSNYTFYIMHTTIQRFGVMVFIKKKIKKLMFIVNDGLWKKGKKRILSEIKFYKVYFLQISRRCTFILTS